MGDDDDLLQNQEVLDGSVMKKTKKHRIQGQHYREHDADGWRKIAISLIEGQ
jgi:esterase/lipase superfamily enzyme